MSPELIWPWLAILLLGAVHGINPAMGWLFAVALGLQQERRAAVWRALLPLALGHALAIGAAVLIALLAGRVLPLGPLKWIVAAVLAGFGAYHLLRARHPRWGGMRVGFGDLTFWSFLMGSAHGAGLMILPFLFEVIGGAAGANGTLPGPGAAAAHSGVLAAGLGSDQVIGLIATLVHSAAYLLITGLVAVIVYEKLGLRFLRRAWLNLDLIWGAALIATAVVTPLI